MNEKELVALRNKRARVFDQVSRMRRNTLSFTRQNSEMHYMHQFALCFEAFKKGEHFLTEATFESATWGGRRRADFVNLDTGEVWEVPMSEGKESLENKRKFWEKHGFKMKVFGDVNEL